MKFYYPGFISATKEKYFEIEKREGALPKYPTDEYRTVNALLCMDENDELKHIEGYYPFSAITDCFSRARELNMENGNIRRFDTWQEFARDWRHHCRRFAAMAVPYRTEGQLIPYTTSLLRMIAVYMSWPYEVVESDDALIELVKKYDALFHAKHGRKPTKRYELAYTAVREMNRLEGLYMDLVPRHTRDVFRSGSQFEMILRDCAFCELVWEKFDDNGELSPLANKPYSERLRQSGF